MTTTVIILHLAKLSHNHGKLVNYERLSTEPKLYAALRAEALEKSATTTLSVAFNWFCPLITENSSRARNLFQPKHPVKSKTSPYLILKVQILYLSFAKTAPLFATCLSCSRKPTPLLIDSTSETSFPRLAHTARRMAFNFKCSNYTLPKRLRSSQPIWSDSLIIY